MPIPYIPEGTSKRFRVPRTLAADFTAFLNQDIPNTVMNFELLRDWYDKFEDNYEPKIIRGEIYPDSTKSRYEDTDNNMNFRADVHSGIRKGDMIIQPNGEIFLLDWFVALQSNNAPSRAVRCNMRLTVKRFKGEHTDEDGYVVDDNGYFIDEDGYVCGDVKKEDSWITIVDRLPANAYKYDGRPEYSAVAATPGVTPNTLTIMNIQYNSQTKNIKLDDFFEWGNDTYRIIDINHVGLHISGRYGTLKIQAKKEPGGIDA